MTSEVRNASPTAPLYAELPYPADGVARTTNARILRAGIEQHAPDLLGQERLRIVDVGCGTGENTVSLRRFFPNAEVFGADINRASLDLAEKLAARVGSPARFVQCDLTRDLADALQVAFGGPFDVVVSMGVLHHLSEPKVGFSAVRQIIRPNGLFFCYLYSRHGRREDIATKNLLNEILPADASFGSRSRAISALRLANRHTLWGGLKALRRRLRFGPPLLPWEMVQVALHRNRVVHESDSFSNPCEHLYSLAEIRALLAETGWDYIALAKNSGLPISPEEHSRSPAELELLRRMDQNAMYDYFAFYYQFPGFSFFCRPKGG